MAAVLALVGPAWGQENVEAGKTPAQLYASDCAICHKSPNGLSKAGGLLGLQSFLREHYTASRESAAAIAQYLRTVDKGAPPERKRPPTRTRTTKDEKPKSGEKTGEKAAEPRGKAENGKPVSGKVDGKAKKKPAEAKPAETKPAETKPAESKPEEPKPTPAAASKSSSEKPSEAKPAAAETTPNKPADSKPAESKPADNAPADKPAKSD
jgi:hypothetical protein